MLVLSGSEVARLLDMQSCIAAVEAAFRAPGEGKRASSAVTGLELNGGFLHAKLGALDRTRSYAVAKINANFPDNRARHSLPTIQGVLVLFDASCGTPLAVMDSGMVTALRTAATTAVAARHLAVRNAASATFIGCGVQARAHIDALYQIRTIERVIAFDIDRSAAERFADEARQDFDLTAYVATDIGDAARASEIVITCTPSRRALLDVGDVAAGTFIAAVGADNEHKQEISANLLRASVVVVDDLEQCSRIGDLHHALAAGFMRAEDVRASLDEVVAARVVGRANDQEIIIFDSTGVAIEDVAAAALVYERAG
jgi:alanine dehydrogenase